MGCAAAFLLGRAFIGFSRVAPNRRSRWARHRPSIHGSVSSPWWRDKQGASGKRNRSPGHGWRTTKRVCQWSREMS
uniref:Uncharacterized protein n=1 Tax=Arundo donax TaxID=35708 RepID=A0A0A9GMS8_ARUDO